MTHASEDLQGRRLPNETPVEKFAKGDYARTNCEWWAITPSGTVLTLAPVQMHPDKTISARAGEWTLFRGQWTK